MKKIGLWLLLFALPSHSDATAQLVDRLGQIQQLSASFAQLARDAGGRQIQSVPGQFYLKRPNLMRWETQDPIPQTIVSDGDSLWIYDSDLEQVTRESADTLQNTPAGLLLSLAPEQLADQFEVSLVTDSMGETFQLVPRTEQLYQLIVIEFTGEQPTSLGIVDTTNQQTRIQLREVKMNAELPDSLFVFEVPGGVDLIDARQ